MSCLRSFAEDLVKCSYIISKVVSIGAAIRCHSPVVPTPGLFSVDPVPARLRQIWVWTPTNTPHLSAKAWGHPDATPTHSAKKDEDERRSVKPPDGPPLSQTLQTPHPIPQRCANRNLCLVPYSGRTRSIPFSLVSLSPFVSA